MSLRAEVTDVAGRLVVVLTGSVDLSTVPTLQNTLTRVLVEHPGGPVAVDLDDVEALDDVGIGIILGAAGRARRQGGDLVIVCSNESLRERFSITGLDRAITITPSLMP